MLRSCTRVRRNSRGVRRHRCRLRNRWRRIVDGVVGHLPADHPHPRILAAEQGTQRLEQLLLRLHAERGALAVPHVLGVHPEGAEVVVLVVAPRRKALEELAFEARNKPGKSGYAIASPSHS